MYPTGGISRLETTGAGLTMITSSWAWNIVTTASPPLKGRSANSGNSSSAAAYLTDHTHRHRDRAPRVLSDGGCDDARRSCHYRCAERRGRRISCRDRLPCASVIAADRIGIAVRSFLTGEKASFPLGSAAPIWRRYSGGRACPIGDNVSKLLLSVRPQFLIHDVCRNETRQSVG